jgi:hypothetical protein
MNLARSSFVVRLKLQPKKTLDFDMLADGFLIGLQNNHQVIRFFYIGSTKQEIIIGKK